MREVREAPRPAEANLTKLGVDNVANSLYTVSVANSSYGERRATFDDVGGCDVGGRGRAARVLSPNVRNAIAHRCRPQKATAPGSQVRYKVAAMPRTGAWEREMNGIRSRERPNTRFDIDAGHGVILTVYTPVLTAAEQPS